MITNQVVKTTKISLLFLLQDICTFKEEDPIFFYALQSTGSKCKPYCTWIIPKHVKSLHWEIDNCLSLNVFHILYQNLNFFSLFKNVIKTTWLHLISRFMSTYAKNVRSISTIWGCIWSVLEQYGRGKRPKSNNYMMYKYIWRTQFSTFCTYRWIEATKRRYMYHSV